MRVRVSILVALAVAVLTLASVAQAHPPDSLGVPDPYWQNIAGASAAGDGVSEGGTPSRAAPLPRLRRFLVYGSGVACVLLAASLLRALRGSTRRPS